MNSYNKRIYMQIFFLKIENSNFVILYLYQIKILVKSNLNKTRL